MSVFAVGVESKLNFSYYKSIKGVNYDPVAQVDRATAF